MSFTAIPTKTIQDTLVRTLQLVQKTNSWTQSQDLVQTEDSQGKTRSAFCLRGAIRAAIAGETSAADHPPVTSRANRLAKSAGNAIVKTVNSNPTRYGRETEDDTVDGLVGFNDSSATKHRHVVRALRDTLAKADSAPAILTRSVNVGCGG